MSPHGHLRIGVGLMAAAAVIAHRNMRVAASLGHAPMAVTAAEVHGLAGNFAFNQRFLPRSGRHRTGDRAVQRAALKARNRRKEKRHG